MVRNNTNDPLYYGPRSLSNNIANPYARNTPNSSWGKQKIAQETTVTQPRPQAKATQWGSISAGIPNMMSRHPNAWHPPKEEAFTQINAFASQKARELSKKGMPTNLAEVYDTYNKARQLNSPPHSVVLSPGVVASLATGKPIPKAPVQGTASQGTPAQGTNTANNVLGNNNPTTPSVVKVTKSTPKPIVGGPSSKYDPNETPYTRHKRFAQSHGVTGSDFDRQWQEQIGKGQDPQQWASASWPGMNTGTKSGTKPAVAPTTTAKPAASSTKSTAATTSNPAATTSTPKPTKAAPKKAAPKKPSETKKPTKKA